MTETIKVAESAVHALPWETVTGSTNVAAFAYVEQYPGYGSLWVRFHNGGLYRYEGFPVKVADILRRAESDPEQSFGSTLNRHVKGHPRDRIARVTIETGQDPVYEVAPDGEAVPDALSYDRLGRATYALSRFLFPGFAVNRVEMAEAVLVAIDADHDWLAHLPAKAPVRGEPKTSD